MADHGGDVMPDTDTLAALLHLGCLAHINGEQAWCKRTATRLHAAGVRMADPAAPLDVERLARLAFPGPSLDPWQKGWNAALLAATPAPKEADRE